MTRFCFDTSAFIDAWRLYPNDVFPTIWNTFDDMGQSGLLISPDEVLRELQKRDDDLYKWAVRRPGVFIALIPGVQQELRHVLAQYAASAVAQDRTGADPWVIALARVMKAVVVTQERRSGDRGSRKIPDVCDRLGIQCMNLLECLRSIGVRL